MDIKTTTCNPFERKFNNPYEWKNTLLLARH